MYIDGVADSNTPRRMKSWSQSSHFQHNHPHRTADLGEIPDHKQMEKQKKSCQTPGSTPGQGLNYPLILEAVYEFRPREVRRAKVLGGPEIAGPWTVWPGVSQ